MRHWLVLALVVACSHPAGNAHKPPPPPPPDAAVVDASEDVTEAGPDAQRPAPNWDSIGRTQGFDWNAMRKQLERSRVDRQGQPPHSPCTPHQSGQVCEASRISLAARAHVVESKQSLAIVELDVGSDDGVTEYHWAAVLDSAGKPITNYQRVEAIRKRECVVKVILEKALPDGRAVLIVDPPAELKAP
jgi:hypothetical protein